MDLGRLCAPCLLDTTLNVCLQCGQAADGSVGRGQDVSLGSTICSLVDIFKFLRCTKSKDVVLPFQPAIVGMSTVKAAPSAEAARHVRKAFLEFGSCLSDKLDNLVSWVSSQHALLSRQVDVAQAQLTDADRAAVRRAAAEWLSELVSTFRSDIYIEYSPSVLATVCTDHVSEHE